MSASTDLRILPPHDRDCYTCLNLCSGFRLLEYSPLHKHAGQLGPEHVWQRPEYVRGTQDSAKFYFQN